MYILNPKTLDSSVLLTPRPGISQVESFGHVDKRLLKSSSEKSELQRVEGLGSTTVSVILRVYYGFYRVLCVFVCVCVCRGGHPSISEKKVFVSPRWAASPRLQELRPWVAGL